MDEIYISESIQRSCKFLEFSNFEKPSILLMEHFYELLDEKVRRLFYPCNLVYFREKIFYVLRQYLDYNKFEKYHNIQINKIQRIKFKISKILDERTKIEKLWLIHNKDITEMVLQNKHFLYNIGRKIPYKILDKISYIFALILGWEYRSLATKYNKLIKLDVNKISDHMLIKLIIRLKLMIDKVKREGLNYTIKLN